MSGENTALIAAARSQTEDVAAVKKALEGGANPNAVNEQGNSALIFAAMNGHENTVSLLLDSGANINAMNNIGETALNFAVDSRKVNVVKLLCARGADPFFKGLDYIDADDHDEIKAVMKSHKACMQLKYGLFSALSIGSVLLSSDPMLHVGASVLAFGISCYFDGIKSYEARAASSYLASTALWCATSLVAEEYAVYCQIGAGVIAAATTLYVAYPYLTTPSPEKGV